MSDQNQEINKEDLREENCLYQVVDKGLNTVYLQNTRNNRIFEETEIPQEIQDKIEEDYILRYKGGMYIIEEELTDDFFESLVDMVEYKRIQEDFINQSNILEIDSDVRFSIVSREKDFSVLSYGNDVQEKIEVSNVLLPYFVDDTTVLYYKNGKFEKEIN